MASNLEFEEIKIDEKMVTIQSTKNNINEITDQINMYLADLYERIKILEK